MVRLTEPAMADLQRMVRKGDPQVVRWALKKCLLLGRDPLAGEELRGGLVGYRKLVVGDRNWRVVWRVTHDDTGRPVVDVAEVWALGARADAEVYEEMLARVAMLPAAPSTIPLAEVVERLGRLAGGISPTRAEPTRGPDQGSAPDWLVQALVKVAGMHPEEVAALHPDDAAARWAAFTSRPQH